MPATKIPSKFMQSLRVTEQGSGGRWGRITLYQAPGCPECSSYLLPGLYCPECEKAVAAIFCDACHGKGHGDTECSRDCKYCTCRRRDEQYCPHCEPENGCEECGESGRIVLPLDVVAREQRAVLAGMTREQARAFLGQ